MYVRGAKNDPYDLTKWIMFFMSSFAFNILSSCVSHLLSDVYKSNVKTHTLAYMPWIVLV